MKIKNMAIKEQSQATIVLFVYNQPWNTKQTVEALQKNNYEELKL